MLWTMWSRNGNPHKWSLEIPEGDREDLLVSSLGLALRARLAVQGSFKTASGDFVIVLLRFKSSPGNNKQKNRQTAVLLFDGRGERI